MNSTGKIRVLIVDDSAIVRKILSEALAGEQDIEVVGAAPDPFIARDKILALRPDVLTLDIEMPRMDGVTFLKRLMVHRPMPVIVISSIAQRGCQAAMEAMQAGAVEVLAKPGGPYSVGDLRLSLATKIRAAAASRRYPAPRSLVHPIVAPPVAPSNATHHRLIAIGASTGGTEAIAQVLTALPEDTPPIVITQHIPPAFSRAFAERLNAICKLRVKEAEDGDTVSRGAALVAPGGLHMMVRKVPGGYRVVVKDGPMVCYQRPSVDVLFSSVADAARGDAVGVILTGMGSDGAQGMLKMRQAGASTIAQDEATCVVFGMPREAIRTGAAEHVLPLSRIGSAMLSAACRAAPRSVA